MKRIIYLVVLIFLFTNSYSQSSPVISSPLVKVNEWGSRAYYLLDGYFKETKSDIIKLVGEEEFNKIKKNCGSGAWPSEFRPSDGISDADEKTFYEKLNKLKMFKIATYQHKYNGNIFDKYVILKIPYHENEFWNSNVKWDEDVYFIIKETDVEEISEN